MGGLRHLRRSIARHKGIAWPAMSKRRRAENGIKSPQETLRRALGRVPAPSVVPVHTGLAGRFMGFLKRLAKGGI